MIDYEREARELVFLITEDDSGVDMSWEDWKNIQINRVIEALKKAEERRRQLANEERNILIAIGERHGLLRGAEIAEKCDCMGSQCHCKFIAQAIRKEANSNEEND